MIENSGANVVMDDICIGARHFWTDVEVGNEPLKNLVNRYLEKVSCPRTFKKRVGSYEDDLENRFGYLGNFAREFNVNGVIHYVTRYCDTFAFDLPDVREYFKRAGLPILSIEDEYVTTGMARLKTRVQAFVEMIS